jgi:hypothetical protein
VLSPERCTLLAATVMWLRSGAMHVAVPSFGLATGGGYEGTEALQEESYGWTALLTRTVLSDTTPGLSLRDAGGMADDLREDCGCGIESQTVRVTCGRSLGGVGALHREYGKVWSATIAVRTGGMPASTHIHVHHAVMRSVTAAACGQACFCVRGHRKKRRDDGEAEEDEQQDGEDTTHWVHDSA